MDVEERIRELLDDIREKGLLVLVEGPKDRSALERFGVTNVLCIKKPLFAVVEEIAERAKEVVILTDLDAEGRRLFARLRRDVQKFGVRVDNRLREVLFKTKLRQVEGLPSYLGSA